jgi:hypothetical protein
MHDWQDALQPSPGAHIFSTDAHVESAWHASTASQHFCARHCEQAPVDDDVHWFAPAPLLDPDPPAAPLDADPLLDPDPPVLVDPDVLLPLELLVEPDPPFDVPPPLIPERPPSSPPPPPPPELELQPNAPAANTRTSTLHPPVVVFT